MRRPVYMDYHSTTPVDRRVLEAMLPYFTEEFGNAASRTHAYGWAAGEGVEEARQKLAGALRCRPRELVFTSGATEANNLAIKGVVEYHRDREPHVVTCATEHPSVLDSCRALERKGQATLTVLPVDSTGRVDPEAVREAITDRTVLVSVMVANNEIGTLQPVAEIGRITREKGVLFHTDATQAIGKVPFDVESAGVDLVAFSSHKVYGPKGVGALFVRGRNPRVRLVAQMDGGGHERGLRSGTLNVPAIVGFGRAVEIAEEEREDEANRLLALRNRLVEQLFAGLDELRVNGHPEERLPGNANVSFRFVEAESLLMALDKDVALSSGSACTSATLEPSHVLRAIGLRPDEAEGSVRFGLGRFTTTEDVEWVTDRVVREVKRLRALSPFYAARKPKTRDRATA